MNVFLSLPSNELELYTDLEQLQLELKLGEARKQRKLDDLRAQLRSCKEYSEELQKDLRETKRQLPQDPLTPLNEAPPSACWEFLAHKPDGWSPVEAEAAQAIEKHYQSGKRACQVQIHQYVYYMDLKAYTQLNRETGKARELRRRVAPDAANSDAGKAKLRDELEGERAIRQCKERDLGLAFRAVERLTRFRKSLRGQLASSYKACKKHKLELNRLKHEARKATGRQRHLEEQLAEFREDMPVVKQELAKLRAASELKDTQMLSSLTDVSTLCSGSSCSIRCISHVHPKYNALRNLFLRSMTCHREDYRSNRWLSPPRVNVTRIYEVANRTRQLLYEAARSGEVLHRNKSGCNAIPNIKAFKCTVEPGCVDLNEHLLFHGCPLHSVEDIARRGLDPQRGGEAVGSMFGRGAYFAQNASKSDLYTTCADCGPGCSYDSCRHAAGERCILVVRVLLGESFSVTDQKVPPDSIRAPERSDGELHESITAQAKDHGGRVDHMEFVTFEKQLSLVQYLIYYHHEDWCECHNCKRRST